MGTAGASRAWKSFLFPGPPVPTHHKLPQHHSVAKVSGQLPWEKQVVPLSPRLLSMPISEINHGVPFSPGGLSLFLEV